MLKILQINTVCGIGSTGRIAADIHNMLIKQGHDSYIAYGRESAQNCETSIKIGNIASIYSHVAVTRLFDRHGFGSVKATKDFIKKIIILDPDIIHLHNIHGYYINIKILFDYLKDAKKPVIWTMHDCWNFTGHCAYFDYVRCYKWEKACCDCPQKHTYPYTYFMDNSKRNFEEKRELFANIENLTIVTPSQWLSDLVKKSFLKDNIIKVINNGIDLNIFKPTFSDIRSKLSLENKFIILGVANVWDDRKGLQYFIDISDKLNDDEIIIIVGLKEIQKKSLPSNIIGITKTNDVKKLVELYSIADIFINPTLEDNFPTVNLEALACGTPVITFNTGGSIESLDDSCGLIISKGNTLELLNSIAKVKNRKKDSYYRYCIDKATRLYNKNDKYMEYINLYKIVMELDQLKEC